MSRAKKIRKSGEYPLHDDWGEQVTPMSDGWYVVHHTETPNEYWWAVRHQCAEDGKVYGMTFRPRLTTCHGCKIALPKEIEGFITMIEWKR